MTTLTFGGLRSAQTTHRTAFSIMAPIDRLAREWRYWMARRAMAQLDDAALHDMGLGRGEIDGAVRHGRSA